MAIFGLVGAIVYLSVMLWSFVTKRRGALPYYHGILIACWLVVFIVMQVMHLDLVRYGSLFLVAPVTGVVGLFWAVRKGKFPSAPRRQAA